MPRAGMEKQLKKQEETKLFPEKCWLEDYVPFEMVPFQVHFNFPGVSCENDWSKVNQT